MAGLRERRHEQTRADIVDAAFRLFAQHGYRNVTMEEIAAAAGVSRSTAYRRFPTKEDVVLDVPKRWLGAFDEARVGLPPDTSLADALGTCVVAVAAHIDDHLDLVRTAYHVLDEAPHLRVSGVATAEWVERVVAVVSAFSDFEPERAAIVAGAYLGAIDAMMARWAGDGGTGSVAAATRRLHDRLEVLLT